MAADVNRRIGSAVVWSGLNTIVTRVVNVVMTAVVVRIVTPEEFGTYAVALTVFTVISGFSELGLSACLARKDLDPERLGPTVSALSLIFGALLAGLLALLAGPLASVLGAPAAEEPLRVLSLCVLMVGVFTVPVGMVTREFRQDALFIATLVSFVPSNILLVWMASNGDGAMAFAWSRVLGQIVMGGVLFYYASRSFWPKLVREHAAFVLSFGVPVAGANLVRYILLSADYLFVGRLLGPVAVGIYMLAFNVGSWASSVLSGMINSVAMPAFSHESGHRDGLGRMLRQSITMVAVVAFPIAGLSTVLARPIVEVLYGDQWLAAVPLLAVLSVYGALFSLTLLLGNLLVAVGESGRVLVLQLLWLVGLAPAMVLGVLAGDLAGAAVAHIVTIVVVVIPAHLWFIGKHVDGATRMLLTGCARPVALTAIAALAAWAASLAVDAPWPRLLLGGMVGSSLYLLLALPILRQFLPGSLLGRVAPALRLYDRSLGRVTTPLLAPETGTTRTSA